MAERERHPAEGQEQESKGERTVSEAGHKGGQKVEEGKEKEGEESR